MLYVVHSLSLRGSKRVNAALPRVTAAGGRSAYTFRIVLLALAVGAGVLHEHVCLSCLPPSVLHAVLLQWCSGERLEVVECSTTPARSGWLTAVGIPARAACYSAVLH